MQVEMVGRLAVRSGTPVITTTLDTYYTIVDGASITFAGSNKTISVDQVEPKHFNQYVLALCEVNI